MLASLALFAAASYVPEPANLEFADARPAASGRGVAPLGRVTDPALSPDGKTLAFVWQGDIWTVPAEGGAAARLTVHPAREGNPVWSPDGSFLAFTSNRHGSLDVFRMAPDGSALRRLTFDSGSEYPTAVSPDGKTVLGYTTAFSRMDLFAVSSSGGDVVRLTGHPLELEHQPCFLPDGKTVVYCQGGSPGHWRKPGQRGANTARLYSGTFGAPLGSPKRLTTGDRYDLFPVPLGEGRIAFVSNRDGAPNLYSMPSSGGAARRHTHFSSGTVRALSASRDGKKAAFQKDSGVWILDVATGQASRVAILAPADTPRELETRVRLDTGASALAVSPNGKRAVVAVRGDLYLIPEKGGTTRRLTQSNRLDSQPAWLDDETIVYCAAGPLSKRELRKVTIHGADSVFLSDPLDLVHPVPSPDRTSVAFQRGNRELMVVAASGGFPRKVAEGAFGDSLSGSRTHAWSPDGAWIVYRTPLERSVAVAAAEAATGRTVELARIGKGANAPVFTPDAKFVAFSGVQGVDYSETRDTVAPLFSLRLEPAPLEFREDDLDGIDVAKDPAGKPQVAIEPAGLADRLAKATTVSASGVWPGPDGSKVYTNVDGQFSVVDLATGSARPVAGVTGTAGGVTLSADGKKTYFLQAGKAFSLAAGAQAPSPIPFLAEAAIPVAEEEAALFDEVWWVLDRLYYDPAMHGKDWAAIRSDFAKLVPEAQSREEFYDLVGEMMELLDSSHLGATAPASWRPAYSESVAWLGVEWDYAALLARGEHRVAKVYAGTAADHPASRLVPGDAVLAVDGVAPTASRPMAALLEDKSGRRTRLKVRRGGEEVEVVLRPGSGASRTGVLYRDWVEWNRAEVARLSDGKLGYVHIQGMDVGSLDRFLTEIQTTLEGKSGVVVDVRFNGGGFTAHIILNIMRKTPWLIRTNRDEPGNRYSENTYRGNALELPAVCLANQYSFSNAEIFSEGFRRLGLGKVVGEPTAGGVIGTGAYGLWDGGSVRLPGSGAYAVDGENLEGNGRRPDIRVDFDPAAWAAGRDPQLEAAVKALLQSR